MHEQTKNCWDEIVNQLNLKEHDFSSPFFVEHKRIKEIVSKFTSIPNNKKEIRILGSITQRENKPPFFKENNIFLLPSSNNEWVLGVADSFFEHVQEMRAEIWWIQSYVTINAPE